MYAASPLLLLHALGRVLLKYLGSESWAVTCSHAVGAAEAGCRSSEAQQAATKRSTDLCATQLRLKNGSTSITMILTKFCCLRFLASLRSREGRVHCLNSDRGRIVQDMSTFIDGDGICGKSGMMGIPVDIEIRSWAGYEGVAHRNGSVGGCDLALQRAVLGGDLGEFVT